MAALVDGLIVFGVLGLLIALVFLTSSQAGVFELLLSFVIGYLVLGWLYFGLTESSKAGGGVGKRMAKIKVVKANDGSIPGFAAVSMRSLLKLLCLPFALVALLTPRRQGLHDLACGTLVVPIEGLEDDENLA